MIKGTPDSLSNIFSSAVELEASPADRKVFTRTMLPDVKFVKSYVVIRMLLKRNYKLEPISRFACWISVQSSL